MRRLVRIDCRLFDAVAHSRTPWLDRGLPALSRSANHSKLWTGTAALLALTGGRAGARAAGRGLGSIAVTSLVVNQTIKRAVRRPRPLLRNVPVVRRLKVQPLTTSFPSGHAASAAAFATAVAIEKPRAAPPVALAGAAVAYSRVYVGVHYPLDVATGVGIGLAVALLSQRPWPGVPRRAGAQPPGERASDAPPAPGGAGLAVVANANAGGHLGGDGLARKLPAARLLEVEDPECLPAALAEAARGGDVLGVWGGDGTAAEGAAAALDVGCPLLVLPGGTLNHLARDLRIDSLDQALDALQRGEALGVDVAAVDGRPFLNTVGFGAYPAMLDARTPLQRRIGRWPAQIVAVALTLAGARPLELEVDGRPRRVWIGLVGNCRHEPGGFAPSWRPRLDDGLLDVRLLLGERRWSRLRLLGALLAGRLERSADYERFAARHLRLETRGQPLRLARDGDCFTGGRSVEIEKRGRLAVYAPAGL